MTTDRHGEGFMHPLVQIAFDPRNNDLYINSGSATDHCAIQAGTAEYKYCPETEDNKGVGSILRIRQSVLKNVPPTGVKLTDIEIVAMGLRNSMAMVIHPSGTLIQGENSRDFPEFEEPYEEINVIDLNDPTRYHYGWPYCYNFHATSPEWFEKANKDLAIHKSYKTPVDCNQRDPKGHGSYKAPHVLIPPHASPLHMAYYRGAMFPELQDKLLVSWHGSVPSGQRFVSYDVDDKGQPILEEGFDPAKAFYRFNATGGAVVKRQMKPHGGLERVASAYNELISQWAKKDIERPRGNPTGFTVASDGSIFIVDDKKGNIVRLAKSDRTYRDPESASDGMSVDPKVELLAWRHHIKQNSVRLQGYNVVQTNLIQKNCLGCHGNMEADDIAKDRFKHLDFIVKNGWIKGGDKMESPLYGAIAHLPAFKPMPPKDKVQFHGTAAGDQLIKQVGDWIDGLTPDISKSYTRITTARIREIRESASFKSKVCGSFQAKDVVYVDQRESERPKAEGMVWTKVYIVPGHTRLIAGKCAPREDGVYWMDLVKAK